MTTPEEIEDMMSDFFPNPIDADIKARVVKRETDKLQMPLVFPLRSDLTDLIGPEWDWDVSDDMRSDLLGC